MDDKTLKAVVGMPDELRLEKQALLNAARMVGARLEALEDVLLRDSVSRLNDEA